MSRPRFDAGLRRGRPCAEQRSGLDRALGPTNATAQTEGPNLAAFLADTTARFNAARAGSDGELPV